MDSTISGAEMSDSRQPPAAKYAVLSVAGLDPSAGAGIMADARVFTAHGLYATGVVTALTVQDTSAVLEVEAVEAELFERQLARLTADIPPVASKTGMLANGDLADVVADAAGRNQLGRLVVDPVLASTGGRQLADDSLIRALKDKLIPFSDLVTPNLQEAEVLTGQSVDDMDGARRAATGLLDMGAAAVCITGGHWPGEPVDLLVHDGGSIVLEAQGSHPDRPVHGTGCYFSAAIVARLAYGEDMLAAVRGAKDETAAAIANAVLPGSGMRVPWLGAPFESGGGRD